MIDILLKGVDEFLGAQVETQLTPAIAGICHVGNDEVMVTCLHSMIYHGGVDQTSFHMIIQVEAEERFRQFEKELAEYLLKASKEFSVHCRLNFRYTDGGAYQRIDPDYPPFVTKSNSVEIASDESSEEDEIYTGDIFENFEELLGRNDRKKS